SVVAASQKERLAKPIKQAPVAQKDAQPGQKHKATHVARKRNEEAATLPSGFNAYGYAEQPRRFYQYPSFFFGRERCQPPRPLYINRDCRTKFEMSVMADIPTIGIGPKYSALLPYYIWRQPTYAGESARARFSFARWVRQSV
ncbi:MAG: hypothetical protein WAN42_25675, partial [Pseudolabrys sp.]